MSTSSNRRRTGEPRWLDGTDDDRGGRPALNRRRIVGAALAVVDDEGLAALTIRRLAAVLDVSPMAIYTHVADKAELIDLLVDWVTGEARIAPDPALAWTEQLRSIVVAYHETWTRHPGVVQAYVAAAADARGTATGPNAILQAEQVLSILDRAGFPPETQVQVFMTIYRFIRGTLGMAPTRLDALDADVASAEDLDLLIQRFFGGVDPATVPTFVAAVPHMGSDDSGSFDFALDVMIAGLSAVLGPGR